MKLKNVVVGTRIQAKREINGYSGEVIPKGSEVTVGMVQNPPIDGYPVRIDHEDFSDGYAWVNPADFRKVKEVAVEEAAEAPTKLCDFHDGDVLLCTTSCEGKHQEKCIEGRLYKYIAESKHYIGRVRVGDPELYLGEASVFPENFTLYARKVEDDAAL